MTKYPWEMPWDSISGPLTPDKRAWLAMEMLRADIQVQLEDGPQSRLPLAAYMLRGLADEIDPPADTTTAAPPPRQNTIRLVAGKVLA